ncbi:MAG: alpha/beta fold hydrolase [Chitinophagaceae bacterium]
MASHQLSLTQRIGINYYRTRIMMLKRVSALAAAKATLDLFTKPHRHNKRKDSAFFKHATKFPFQLEDNTLMGYRFSSEHPSGKKLLIIHGFAGSCRAFEKYISSALKKGYDVYTFDAPAHGLSQGKRLNAMMYRDAIMEMIQLNGPFDAYISHSLGGLSLMLALEQQPPLSAQKIVLIAPVTESITAADNFFGLLQLPRDLRLAFDKLIADTKGLPLSWYSVSRVLPLVPADILWVHDKDDPTTPIKDVLPIAGEKPQNIQFYFTEGLGHSGIYREIAVRNLVEDFL